MTHSDEPAERLQKVAAQLHEAQRIVNIAQSLARDVLDHMRAKDKEAENFQHARETSTRMFDAMQECSGSNLIAIVATASIVASLANGMFTDDDPIAMKLRELGVTVDAYIMMIGILAQHIVKMQHTNRAALDNAVSASNGHAH